jgi:hypothetical protein
MFFYPDERGDISARHLLLADWRMGLAVAAAVTRAKRQRRARRSRKLKCSP